jgi:hypothetical protein
VENNLLPVAGKEHTEVILFYVYKVGFIRQKGKATAREVQWSPEAGGSTQMLFTKQCPS